MKVETYLPVFQGFYNTPFEPNEINDVDYINSERVSKGLNELDFEDFDFDYDSYYRGVAICCTTFIESILKEMDVCEKIEFQKIESPREYNFANDSIYIEIDINDSQKANIISYIKNDYELFENFIKERFTDRDGFISFYSNNPETWLNTINESLEHKTKLGVILEFLCLVYENENDNNLYDELINYVDENGELSVPLKNIDASINNLLCTKCNKLILNQWENRSLIAAINNKTLTLDNVVCSDCSI